MSKTRPAIFTIPPTVSFVDTLATSLMKDVKGQHEKLAQYLILLPTRRACRSLRDAFLRQTEGAPVLLPRLQAIGDIDAEELFISGEDEIDIPPAMPTLERQILLSKTIAGLPDFTKGPQQDIALARALGTLMDQIHTENLDLADLPNLVDREAFANHWQITVDFLSILSEHWPNILAERGMIDSADRRNRLINALNKHWCDNPPDYPVIAAGTTGSIPATSALLKTVSHMPQGSVILPGLDNIMSPQAWDNIEEGHPQATLKKLLSDLDCAREDVQEWSSKGADKNAGAKEKLISDVMVPPEQANDWTKSANTTSEKTEIQHAIRHIRQYDCKTPQEEAELIGILLRETLEDSGKTAALITPDRNLARRVAMICRRWNITIDDSAGYSLDTSILGTYLISCAQCCANNLRPASFLAFLKHDYCHGGNFKDFRSAVRLLDEGLMRGKAPKSGFEGLRQRFHDYMDDEDRKKKPDEVTLNLINHLEPVLSPFITIMHDGFHDFSKFLELHIQTAEKMSADKNDFSLWSGDEGEETAAFLSELKLHAPSLPSMTGADYIEILTEFMRSKTIRPKYGTHPRLMILGQLEARLLQADRVILAGLNEGTWPPNPDTDPWMSRPMRKDFGLPTPERSITLAAHDFVQGFCNKEVFLTRAERVDGTPTVPARWLQRLGTYLKAAEIDSSTLYEGPHKQYLQQLNNVEEITPISRPAPNPPVSARPQKLSVTKIETWMKDPYAIYANKILRLNALDPIEKKPDAADKGSVLHNILQNFTRTYKNKLPATAEKDFIDIAIDVVEKQTNEEPEWNFWMPRIMQLAGWFISHEQEWRQSARFRLAEAKGEATFNEGLQAPFTLECRADRLDKKHTGGMAIIDYKSGGTYSVKKMQSGELPQLPLEALILTEGGFAVSGIQETSIDTIAYWKLTGGKIAGEVTAIDSPEKLTKIIETTKSGLLNLVATFENENTPYYAIPRLDNAPRFNDYAYLERVKEWAALDENTEEAT